MMDASQSMLDVNSQGGERAAGGGMNPVMKRHLELEIKTLQNAPRDADKLERLLQIKRRQKEEAMLMEDTQRLVTEIEMLKVVLYLVSRNKRR
jgi:methyl coenzyme M reductase beta subunit